jgi:hypothetical protein
LKIYDSGVADDETRQNAHADIRPHIKASLNPDHLIAASPKWQPTMSVI